MSEIIKFPSRKLQKKKANFDIAESLDKEFFQLAMQKEHEKQQALDLRGDLDECVSKIRLKATVFAVYTLIILGLYFLYLENYLFIEVSTTGIILGFIALITMSFVSVLVFHKNLSNNFNHMKKTLNECIQIRALPRNSRYYDKLKLNLFK